jgi:hypothetical protein
MLEPWRVSVPAVITWKAMAPVLNALQDLSLQKTPLSVPLVQLELSLQPVDPHNVLSVPLEHTLQLTPLHAKLALLDISHPEVPIVAPHALLVHMRLMNHALPALPETSLTLLVPHHVVHAFQERTPLNLPPLHANRAKLISTLLYIIPYPAINVLLSVLLQLLRALTVPSVLLVIINCLSIAISALQDHTLPLIPLSVFHALLETYQQPVAKIVVQHAPTAII